LSEDWDNPEFEKNYQSRLLDAVTVIGLAKGRNNHIALKDKRCGMNLKYLGFDPTLRSNISK
jgi:hypothetical protein